MDRKIKYEDFKYKENPKRAIFIDCEIEEPLFKKLAKEIQFLRFESAEPITVYLDSEGGNVEYAKRILNLLKAPRQDKSVCDIITVVHSKCGSAATDLLIRGDYAIAYPNAEIQYHGVSQLIDFSVNTQDALQITNGLKNQNEEFAYELTKHISERIFGIIIESKKSYRNLPGYFKFLEKNLSSRNYDLIENVMVNMEELSFLMELTSKINTKRKTEIEKEMEIYRIVLDYKIDETRRFMRSEKIFLDSEYIIEEVGMLFGPILDLHNGRYISLIKEKSDYFMQGYDALPSDNPGKSKVPSRNELLKVIVDTYADIIKFTLTFCRLLLDGERNFSANEAYYLGLVDEVIGLPKIYNGKL